MASIEQQLSGVVVAQPISVVKDPDLLNRLKIAFLGQLKEIKRRTLEDPQHLVVPTMPDTKVADNDNIDENPTKAQCKRGRKTTTKLLLEVPFSFEPPTFCIEESIDLEKVLLNRFREGACRDNHVSKCPVTKRLQNWLLEKRERCKDETKDDILIQDYYYLHLPSKLKLRSQQEVINFLLHGDFPRKGGSKKAKLAEAAAVDNQDSSLASRESNRRAEMSSHFLETDIVNQMKSGEEEESKGGMESANKMKSSDEKESNELDNMNDELKNKMKNLEKEIMPWDDEIGLYEMVDNEIENELMIKELLSQPGELLFLPVEKK